MDKAETTGTLIGLLLFGAFIAFLIITAMSDSGTAVPNTHQYQEEMYQQQYQEDLYRPY